MVKCREILCLTAMGVNQNGITFSCVLRIIGGRGIAIAQACRTQVGRLLLP